jgi:hypothetical protein
MSNWYFWLVALPIALLMALTVGVYLVRSGGCNWQMACAQASAIFGATHAALLCLRRLWWR